MINKLAIISSLILALNLCGICTAEVSMEKSFEETKKVLIPCKCQLKDSLIIGSEPTKETCGEGGKNYFEFKGNVDDMNKLFDKLLVIDSWKRLKYIKSKFQSPALQAIKRTDFSKYNYAVMLVTYTGLRFLENEKLYEKNGQLYFSYEIWVGKSDWIPACLDEKLYVLKLKKR